MLLAVTISAAVSAAAEAGACVYLPLVEIGGKLGPAERAAQARRMASKLARERLTAAKSAWAAGADAPAEIAEMVMPNVRPIPINRADCGPSNEIDLADGEEKREDLLRGTKFAGRNCLSASRES